MTTDLTHNLNPQQAAAVIHHGTPLLIVAGAGSGKTRVITHRIAYLAREVGIPLWQILAVTFTNKAAREMRERVCKLLGMVDDPTLAIGTFHSRCAMILRREAAAAKIDRNFAILDDRDQLAAVKKAMEAAEISDKAMKPSQAQHFINQAKMKMLTPQECLATFVGEELPYAEVYHEYEEVLQRNASLDFEDLIWRCVKLFREVPEALSRWNTKFKYLLVDEFQDTNYSQFELVKLLAGPQRNVCVVGDEDQSIYSWRGAEVTNLLEFQKIYPDAHIIRLEQNYRSSGNILKAAAGVIKHNTMRIGKTLWTDRDEGEIVQAIGGADDIEEARLVTGEMARLLAGEGVAPTEVAVFYRSHRLSRAIEDAMLKYRIPYRIVGAVRFYDRAEIKDLLSLLRLAVQPTNDLAFERVVNVPTRGVGQKTQGEIAARAALRQMSQYEVSREMLKEGAIKGKARTGLAEFLDAIDGWHSSVSTANAREMVRRVLAETRYKTEGVGDVNSIDGRSRLENIEEFEQVVSEFEQSHTDHTLAAFLEEMSLDAQREEGDDRPKVSLMTVHNAKGLEFDYVFIIGLEHGLFPNSRTMDKREQFEEERRLFYVAVTRARKQLYISRSFRRMLNGSYEGTQPSQFLYELPEEVLSDDARRRLGIRAAGGANPGSSPARNDYNPQRGYYAATSGIGAGTAASKGSLRVGDRVEHRVMGKGVVTEAGGRPGSEKVYVEFDDGREQEFVVRYAGLVKV